MAYGYLAKSREISDIISRTDGSGKLMRDNLNFLRGMIFRSLKVISLMYMTLVILGLCISELLLDGFQIPHTKMMISSWQIMRVRIMPNYLLRNFDAYSNALNFLFGQGPHKRQSGSNLSSKIEAGVLWTEKE
jgi:hypothetical protein